MFCEKCGTKNKSSSKFCEKCGNKLETKEIKDDNKVIARIKNLSKKSKIVMGIVILLVIIAIIVLAILLNNPVKKVGDYIDAYYTNYSENNTTELVKIGDILIQNKGDNDTLESIKNTIHSKIETWINNYNKSYSNTDELDEAYQKLSGTIIALYEYYDGLEYVLSYEDANNYDDEVYNLYKSKTNYLKGLEYENNDNSYYAYYYYQKVIESDCYYKSAQEYISSYVEEELTTFKEEVENIITTNSDNSNKELLDNYILQLKYILDNKTVNYIDLSSTEDYKSILENARSKVYEYAKKVIDDLNNEGEYEDIIELIDEIISYFDSDSDMYKEIVELKETYEDKLPISLLDVYRVSYSGVNYSKYVKTINGEEYNSYLSFSNSNDNIVYRLNGEYKTLKTQIVKGENWNEELSGYFIIYGDDEEIYRTSDLDSEIEVDVTGVNDLKIAFIVTSKSVTFSIYLVEPYLYK